MAPEYTRQRARDVNLLMAMILAEMLLVDEGKAVDSPGDVAGGQEPTE